MTRFILLLAVLAMTVGSAGCGCCRWLYPQQQAVVAAPACPPAQACDPYTSAPVTYGTVPTSPMYAPAPQW